MHRFEQGNTLSKGRPRGARNKLASSVFNDVMAVWNEPVSEGNPLTKGKAAMLAMCRRSRPNSLRRCSESCRASLCLKAF
jgi:hypothetical protein